MRTTTPMAERSPQAYDEKARAAFGLEGSEFNLAARVGVDGSANVTFTPGDGSAYQLHLARWGRDLLVAQVNRGCRCALFSLGGAGRISQHYVAEKLGVTNLPALWATTAVINVVLDPRSEAFGG